MDGIPLFNLLLFDNMWFMNFLFIIVYYLDETLPVPLYKKSQLRVSDDKITSLILPRIKGFIRELRASNVIKNIYLLRINTLKPY